MTVASEPGAPPSVDDAPATGAAARSIPIDKSSADRLAGRLCAAAASAAQASSTLLELIAEFDASGAIRHWGDVKSLAHWLTRMCEMTPGVAREHVRVARALVLMPNVQREHRAGRLSYSKVRELSRVVDVLDEGRMLEWARVMTAAQLAHVVSAYRNGNDTPLAQHARRRVSWWETDDGMVSLHARLTREDAAVITQAMRQAQDASRPVPPSLDPQTGIASSDDVGNLTLADALVQIGRTYLAAAPTDESGEDRTLVVVHVAANLLADPTSADVPAGTSTDENVCSIEGQGAIAVTTAQRLACDRPLLPVVVRDGEPLALGRTRRPVTRSLRRALRIRDGMCRYPGCHQSRHLDAHHVIPWSTGGPTDLDNLVLLCRFHHTVVHEGAIRLERSGGEAPHWNFWHPDGGSTVEWESDASLMLWLTELERRRSERLSSVDGLHHPDARTIRGHDDAHPFDIAACTQTLYGLQAGNGIEKPKQPDEASPDRPATQSSEDAA